MHETRERCAGRFVDLRLSRPRVVAQARLFVFLTLLVPLFGVLGGVVADGVPSVEVRVVPREVTVNVPVEVVVERIVDRLAFGRPRRSRCIRGRSRCGGCSGGTCRGCRRWARRRSRCLFVPSL